MRHNKVIVTTLMMPPWESFQGRETGEWKRDICAFIRTRRRRKEDKPVSFFGLVQKIFFACPLDSCTMGIMLQVILGMFQFLLLTRIPTSHAKVCMYGSFDLLYIYIYIYSWCVGAWWGVVTLWKLSSGSMTPVTSGPVAEKHNETLRD